MIQPPQHVIPGDSARQRRLIDTTRTRKARSTAGGSRGSNRFLRGALEVVVYRTSLFDGKHFNVESDSRRKIYRHSHFLIPRFLARELHGDSLPMCARAVSRQAAWQLQALPRPSCAFQPVVEHLSELHPSFERLLCSSSTLSIPNFVYLAPLSLFVCLPGLKVNDM